MSYNCSESSYGSSDASDDDGYVLCKHCSNRMPETSLQPHILNKHCISCKYCNAKVLPTSMTVHIKTKHQVETLTEEVQRLHVEIDKFSSRQANSEISYASSDASDDDGYVLCKHCSNRMPETSLQPHILNKHCISCKYCNAKVLPTSMTVHIQTKHQVETLTEEVQRLRVENDKLSSRQAIGFTHNFDDVQFNKLVAQGKICSENNVIYRVK